MYTKIKVPDIGSDEFEVIEILKKIGDEVKKEESLIVIEGDKTSIEIPSPKNGFIKKILIKIGDKIYTNKTIMLFKNNEKIINSFDFFYEKDKKIYISNKFYKKSVIVKNIMIKIGDIINKNSCLISVEENSHITNIISPFKCLIKLIKIKINDVINSNSIIAVIELIKNKNSIFKKNKELFDNKNNLLINKNDLLINKNNNNLKPYATPIIRRLAYEFNINLKKINGTGRKKRIIREDITNYIKNILKKNKDISNSNINDNKILKKINFEKFGKIKVIKLNNIQKISGMNLKKNWRNIPHVTQFDYADITELEIFRKHKNDEFKNLNKNIKITILPFLVKIIFKALKKFKRFNSSLSCNKKKLILKKYFNIGIAVETEKGLLVPVLKDVDKKNIIDIYHELIFLYNKARSGTIKYNDMQGGCFTISNLGGIGGLFFTPIINSPEVAILGLSKSIIKPIWIKDKFVPRLMLPLSLSYDHQVIDGSDGVRFINFIKEISSDIRLLLM
ncbi:2-oxo acid dehydrogenase subunit E2 [Sodalis-like secondary symbiont of Drepanosiphum platanoidis]|uniref:2-oxo acid dehydrogenase subunit E2 n=1 Tax=Sodalis-like secondary symbiont of Drepanosiphum platanoidis TaxID=2994493 RepID=UPI0034648BF2